MIIIFNTASRIGYARNVLRTMFLPVGATNEFRYTIGEDRQISGALAAEIERKGQAEILICFANRYSRGGYTFHPIRKGKITKVEKSGGRVYLSVTLATHVAAVNPNEFTERLYALASEKRGDDRLLALTNDDPSFNKDGRYVFWSEEKLEDLLECGERAWRAASEQLAQARAFASTSTLQFVFSKCELIVDGKHKDYAVRENSSQFEIARDNDLRLRVHYYFPAQNDDVNASAVLSVTGSDALHVLSSTEQPLDTPESRIDFTMAVEPRSDKHFGSVDLEFSSKLDGVQVVGAREAIAVKIYQPTWWWIVAIAAFVIYVVGAIFNVVDEKVVGEVLKIIGVVMMILGLGKKIV